LTDDSATLKRITTSREVGRSSNSHPSSPTEGPDESLRGRRSRVHLALAVRPWPLGRQCGGDPGAGRCALAADPSSARRARHELCFQRWPKPWP